MAFRSFRIPRQPGEQSWNFILQADLSGVYG